MANKQKTPGKKETASKILTELGEAELDVTRLEDRMDELREELKDAKKEYQAAVARLRLLVRDVATGQMRLFD